VSATLRPDFLQVYEVVWDGVTYAVITPLELAQFLIGVGRLDPDFRPTISTCVVLKEAFLRYPTIPFDRFIG